MLKIATLGEGITTKAIHDNAVRLQYEMVDIDDADLLISSPGIPPEKFPNVEIPVISEIEFSYQLIQKQHHKPKLIGVTGTNGKTTVTKLIAHLAQIPVAGNIGYPLINLVGENHSAIVVELSSYQLETCQQFRPDIAILLNLTEDHLERHKTMTEYFNMKMKIATKQTASDVFIYPKDAFNKFTFPKLNTKLVEVNLDEKSSQYLNDSQLIGTHNEINIACAVVAVENLKGDSKDWTSSIQKFSPEPHRLEKVNNRNIKRNFINDSKATNLDATLNAIKSFSHPCHLILCGYDKKLPLEIFIQEVVQNTASVTYYGGISERLDHYQQKYPDHLKKVACLDSALSYILTNSQYDDTILFSPSASSFDLYDNFEHRGDVFKQTVKNL